MADIVNVYGTDGIHEYTRVRADGRDITVIHYIEPGDIVPVVDGSRLEHLPGGEGQ